MQLKSQDLSCSFLGFHFSVGGHWVDLKIGLTDASACGIIIRLVSKEVHKLVEFGL